MRCEFGIQQGQNAWTNIIKINDEHVMLCKSEQVTNNFLFLVF